MKILCLHTELLCAKLYLSRLKAVIMLSLIAVYDSINCGEKETNFDANVDRFMY